LFLADISLTIFLALDQPVFTRVAVICMVLGFITLIGMIFIAVYKSKQQKPVLKGSSKQPEGLGLIVYDLFSFVH